MLGCSSPSETAEPRILIAQRIAARDIGQSVKIDPPKELIDLFVGCYRVELPSNVARPSDWPSALEFQLTSKTRTTNFYFELKSSLPPPPAASWQLEDGLSAGLSWGGMEATNFYLILRLEADGYSGIAQGMALPSG